MTAAEQLPTDTPELRVSQAVRAHMRVVLDHEHGGFVGTSAAEVNAAHLLLSRFDYDGGMMVHLAGIEATSGAESAAKVYGRYTAFADKARIDGFHLGQFGVDLAEVTSELTGRRLAELGFRAMQDVETVIEGGAQLIRYRDLTRIAGNENTGIHPFMPQPKRSPAATDPYTLAQPDRELRLYMGRELGLLRLGEARVLFTAATTDQDNRYNFWASRLKSPRHLSRMSLLAAIREQD